MNIVVDMNLTPAWAEYLNAAGHDAVHWSAIGDPSATDTAIMAYASEHGAVVFTHDLDFGTILAATRARGPSVIQMRAEDVVPSSVGAVVLATLAEHAAALANGALITIETDRRRTRVLPIVPGTRRE